MKKLLFRLPILLIPALFVFLGIFYQDGLYFGISVISFLISLLIIFPSFLAVSLRLPKIKKPKLNLKRGKAEKLSIKKINLRQYYKTALILLGLFTLLFTYISIFKLTNMSNNNNVLLSYFINQFNFIASLSLYAGIGILLISLILLKLMLERKN